MPVNVEPITKVSRPSFRRRLLMTLGPALGIALLLLGLIGWFFAYGVSIYNAQTILDLEIREIEAQIVTAQSTLNPDAYNWNEPHHRYDTQHIDPNFLQVFDARGHLLRASANIGLFPPDTYPRRLLAYQTSEDRLPRQLRTFEIAGKLLYYRTKSVHGQSGRTLGYIQVARYEPHIADLMKRIALFLVAGLLPVLTGLLGLVWWSARRVVRPLEMITREAQTLMPAQLDERITVPPDADNETALLATALNDQLSRLAQSFDEMQRFTADAAHELKTPLTVLQGHASVALRRERSPEEYQEALRVMQKQIEGLIRLVKSLLQLARLDRSEHMLASESVDLVSTIHHTAAFFSDQAAVKGLDFKLQLPDRALVSGQPDLIKEVVANLLDNAVKYTEKGSIHVRVYQEDRTVTLVVEDTGRGMSEEAILRATERFYRAPRIDSQNIPGSGLGLSLVKQIIDRQNGQVSIDSTLNRGTTVTVQFQ